MLCRRHELEKAVKAGDLRKVKNILNSGINSKFLDRQLYHTRSVEIVSELLCHGAHVNTRSADHYDETPLLYAVREEKGYNIVRLLLSHAAKSSSIDSGGNNPLVVALTKANVDTLIVKELMFRGAKISAKKLSAIFKGVDETNVTKLNLIKLIIKMAQLQIGGQSFLREVTEWLNYSYEGSPDYLVKFQMQCMSKVSLLKLVKVSCTSIYNYLVDQNTHLSQLYVSSLISNNDVITPYPLYHDLILRKANLQAYLFNAMHHMHIYTYNKIDGSKVSLNLECVFSLIEYLDNMDLFNFLTAFYRD